MLAESVRFADELEYMGAVGKPIKKRSGKAFISEDLRPVCEAKVRRDDHGDAFVKRRAELKDEMRTGRRKGDEAEFVEDDQVMLKDGGEELCKAVFVLGLHEIIDQASRIVEADLAALAARRDGEAGGDVGLTEPRVADHKERFASECSVPAQGPARAAC